MQIIYELVRQYALDNMGRKFLVALPKSNIMQRIWAGLPVPTIVTKPDIEYVVDQRGYWETVPIELDGVVNQTGSGVFTRDEEEQIRRKFMMEDGRFLAMVGIDWKPTGNINFNSNGINRCMFQDLPTSEFRPNKIASANPSYVLVSCNVSQLAKRPDLALVELPAAIQFDPTDGQILLDNYETDTADDEFIAIKSGIVKYLWYYVKRSDELRSCFKLAAQMHGESFTRYATKIISSWADSLKRDLSSPFQREMSTEIVMDLKGVIIPLTSTWVSYGPWYTTSDQARGMTKIEVDQGLVPWNFDRPVSGELWDANLNVAGFERLSRTIADLDWIDNATIVAAGFPEYGPGSGLGFNSNLNGISVDFGINGVKTTYNFSTFLKKPGTFRKSDYDNISRARIDTREKLPETINENILYQISPAYEGSNRFRY